MYSYSNKEYTLQYRINIYSHYNTYYVYKKRVNMSPLESGVYTPIQGNHTRGPLKHGL